MRLYETTAGLAILASLVYGQTSTSQRYCDSLTSLCFSGWTGGNGVTIGVALPTTTAAPFDTVLQIVSPVKNGWVGFSWGGTMPYVPLTIGWVNPATNASIYSSRIAFGLSLPQPYDGAEYKYLKGSGRNDTHWTLNVLCKGCSQWHDVDGNLVSIDPLAASQKFAHGLASRAPAQPANNRSTFNVHTSFAHWYLDLSKGQNEKFDSLVAGNLIPDAPPASSSVPVPSSTASVRPSTLSTIVSTTTTPAPTQTVVPSSCAGVSKLRFPFATAQGWKVTKVAGDLMQPRGLIFDTAGNLLLIQNGIGITGHKVGPDGCFTSSKTVLAQRNLNHAVILSQDGKTLYASSATSVFAWDYDAATMSVSETPRLVVSGMDSRGHVTRTLVIPPKHPDLLLVSHGSNDNFDYGSADIRIGRSCVKVFDTTKAPADGYNYASGGYQMGYGLRNEVALAFDKDGMLWGIENSSDEIHRTINGSSVDIHIDNPADEMNYLGDPSIANTQWYGYPTCYTVWKPQFITDRKFTVGDQFVLAPNATFNDETCKEKSVPARLSFPAHSAPLDATFSKNFTSLYVTFHGSWNRSPSTGYKIVEVPFRYQTNGSEPKASLANSASGFSDIFWSPEEEHCSTTQCFRPVSIATDRFGRMYVTSDSGAEGEVIILGRD